MNVVRESKPLNNNPATGTGLGQINLMPNTTLWPFIQLYDLTPTGSVVVSYNTGAGQQSATLTFDSVDQFANLETGQAVFQQGADVHLTLIDVQLNIDPTDKDSWTWGTTPGDNSVYYQLFDANGIADADGTSGAVDLRPFIGTEDFMFEDNGLLIIDLDSQFSGIEILRIVDNDFSQTDGSLNVDASTVSTDGNSIIAGHQPVTFTELYHVGGVFTNTDESGTSNLAINPDALAGVSATVDYNETPITILTDFDGDRPVITLLGDNPQFIELSAGYSELGAIATDTEDDDVLVTSNIVINTSAFVDAVGTYPIFYNVVDSDGNPAIPVTRTVVVESNLPEPVLAIDPSINLDDPGDVGRDPSLAIGTDGFPIISHWIGTGSNLELVHCLTLTCEGDVLSPIVTTSDDISSIVSATHDEDGGTLIVFDDAIATDNVGVTVGPTCDAVSGSLFQIGTTTVTCTAEDAAGNVGVATFDVTIIDSDFNLNFLDKFNPVNPGEIQNSIGAVFVDEQDNLYLTITHPETAVKVYDSDRNLTLSLTSDNSDISPGTGLNALAVGNDGTIYLGEAGGERVVIFDSTGNLIHVIDKTVTPSGTKGLGIVNYLEISDDGVLYVSAFNDVQSFDSNFDLIAEFPNSFGVMNLDELGNVQVYNRFSDTMTTFDSVGNVLDQILIPAPPDNTIFVQLESDENGNLLFMDRFGIDSCIHLYSPTGILLELFCSDTEDQFGFYDFDFMRYMTQGDDGNIYVIDNFEVLELTFDNVWCGVLEDDFDNIILGTINDDVLTGTSGNDVLIGLDGDDTLVGKSGDDCILGGNGDDVIKGSKGNDLIDSGMGDDNVNGNAGSDVIFGNMGIDTLLGGNHDDLINGNDGDDILKGGNGNDEIFGGPGLDSIFGNKGDDLLVGDDGNDVLKGGKGDDVLYGNLGNDVLNGGKNTDACEEGFGPDTLKQCETVAPLIANLISGFSAGSPVAGFEYDFEVDGENLGPNPVDNLMFSVIVPTELVFDLDETLNANANFDFDLEIEYVPIDAQFYGLEILVSGPIIDDDVDIEIITNVPSGTPSQIVTISSIIATNHSNFTDLDESDNSVSEDLQILVPP